MEQSLRKSCFSRYSKYRNFEARLDRFWANEEIYYNYKANISSPSPFISFKNAIIQAIAMTHEQDN